MREEIRQAEAEIARIDQLLGTTRKEQGTNLEELRLIETRMENRQTIVRQLEDQVAAVSGQIELKTGHVTELEARSEELKRRYSALIRISYKNYKHNSFLSFVFSARDFTDASRRLYYVKQVAAQLEEKGKELELLGGELAGELVELQDRRTELAELQSRQAQELGKLERDREELKGQQTALRAREGELKAQSEKRRKQVAELELQLQELVRADAARRPAPASGGGGGPTAAARSAQFEAKRGAMLRPVEGVIVDRYGLHDHPTQKGVKVNNKGVNFAAKPGAEVQSVFGGEVRKVFFFQGLGNSVMVRHGAYLTIYANLEEIFVREGDTVFEGHTLGTVARAAGGQQSTLHFEVWKETTNLDPQQWIKK